MSFIKTIPALAAIGALFAQSAFACEQWDISGPRTIDQANGVAVLAEFVQDGAQLGGTATYYSRALKKGEDVAVFGKVAGTVEGNAVRFRVAWEAAYADKCGSLFTGCEPSELDRWESTGVYDGSIDKSGGVSGISFDVKDAANKVGWSLIEPAKCKSAPPAQQAEAIAPGMEDNTDRYGSDYRSFFLDSRTPELCQSACLKDGDKCKAWTYVRPGVQGDKPICYLKDQSSQTSANTCCISGMPPKASDAVKEPGGFAKPTPDKSGAVREQGAGVSNSVGAGMENNTDRPGSDYARFVLTVADPKNCQTACTADQGCSAWTYVRPGVQEANAICYLKRPAPAPVANNCCISGKKSLNPAAVRAQQ